MNISITFRHLDSSEAIKDHTLAKVSKLQKLLRQPMRAKVTLSVDKRKHVAEVQISSGGEHLDAKEATSDLYASIDKVIDKLERQIRASKGVAESKKKRSGETLRAAPEEPEAAELDEDDDDEEEAPAPPRRRTAPATTAKKAAKKKVAKKAPAAPAAAKKKVAKKAPAAAAPARKVTRKAPRGG
ncbi:MAG: ribosome-associated translation inhibitor RaiA [Polyangiaceae bacterium]|nr:ribosome-associated translation inhibitor RaiA [Polyangiaceae bacterium]MCW5791210.1 ribosome-associated translation inhibitor RaiA [Polyangiaceae bacterium]